MTIAQLFHQTLKTTDIDEASLKALLAFLNNYKSNGELFLHWEEEAREIARFNAFLKRLIAGEPLQYVIGRASFDGWDYFVDEAVLIPRPETEELVFHVSEYLKSNNAATLLDLGTGSGCIAISLKHRFPSLKVWASDISQCALEVAKKNALNQNVEINFYAGDWFEPFKNMAQKFDVIVSNPPYISSPSTVAKNVLEYEPHSALFSQDGVSNHLLILHGAREFLNPKGLIMLEIDEDQVETLAPIAQTLYKDGKIEFIRDLQGKYRFLRIELSK